MAHDQMIMCQFFLGGTMLEATSIIQKNMHLFLEYIHSFSNSSRTHHFSHKNGGFPIFMRNNTEYYEQMFFDELIENAIWSYLVNGVIRDLFSQKYGSSSDVKCEWTQMQPLFTTSYIEEIEKRYAIEFIVVNNGVREGYRYTNCYYREEQYEQLFKDRELDTLIVLDYSSEEQSSFLHQLVVPKSFASKVKRLPIKEFFARFFSEQIYLEYVSAVRGAVADAYKYVGMQTVTNLTLQYLPYFLEKEVQRIKDFPYTTKSYSILKTMKDKIRKWYGNGVISQEDKIIIQSAFFNQERYLALVGKESFAKSFVTSEYLYFALKDNNQFDYTAIVSGYLKSIEQLLYRILKIVLIDGHAEDVWIQSTKGMRSSRAKKDLTQFQPNPQENWRTQVKVSLKNQDCFDTSFAALVHMLKGYDNGWSISTTARDVICALLSTYCDECRNEHFHKDNISAIAEVETIRDNTFILLYYVLGGYNFSKNGQDEKQVLGVIDNSFERMYREVMRFGEGNYYLIQLNVGDPVLAALPMKQETPCYDENGIMKNPAIRFVRIFRPIDSDWHMDNWGEIEKEMSGEKTLVLTPNNIPKSISYMDKMTGKTTTITW